MCNKDIPKICLQIYTKTGTNNFTFFCEPGAAAGLLGLWRDHGVLVGELFLLFSFSFSSLLIDLVCHK